MEILLDAGIGDIFVIRVAGNVVDTDEAGSIEYGVDHLGTSVLVVSGHTRCGAVTAVVQGDELHGNIPQLVDNIIPVARALKTAHPQLTGESLLEETVKANVWQAVEDLVKRSEVIGRRVKAGNVTVLGAIYDIETGKVNWMGQHPRQDELLAGQDINNIHAQGEESTGHHN